ncbi:hypothetical protein F6V25_15790 [Oryzomonas japonica]|uniref:Uncharacterized protein n=2 Tax=Oryzomonas japonica TaxID=2603858 RepID=A0A7J4ZNA0_9BACT|nr:hypothetical protein F6V25_15790 [Oryzomonas japonica]
MGALFLLGGFTSLPDRLREQLKTSPQHYSQFDVNMGWDVKAEKGITAINGVIQNVRYATMEDIEIWVSSIDASGKVVSRSVGYVIPRTLEKDGLTTFGVTLPTMAAPGTKLIFTYKYSGSDDGGSDGGGTKWMQSFESIVSPPA